MTRKLPHHRWRFYATLGFETCTLCLAQRHRSGLPLRTEYRRVTSMHTENGKVVSIVRGGWTMARPLCRTLAR